MRKRNFRIKFRLNEKEAEHLNKRVMRSGLSRSGCMRQLIDSVSNNDAPPSDYAAATEKLTPIGESFNQIARKSHMLNVIDRQRCAKTLALYNEVIAEIMQAVMLVRNFCRDEEYGKGHAQDERTQ